MKSIKIFYNNSIKLCGFSHNSSCPPVFYVTNIEVVAMKMGVTYEQLNDYLQALRLEYYSLQEEVDVELWAIQNSATPLNIELVDEITFVWKRGN